MSGDESDSRAGTATATALVRRESASCPDHPEAGVMKVWVQEQLKPGVVDWPAVQARLREQGIVLVGGGADEAPEVYKRLPESSPRTATRSG